MEECVEVITHIPDDKLVKIGENAKLLAATLLPKNMVDKAMAVL